MAEQRTASYPSGTRLDIGRDLLIDTVIKSLPEFDARTLDDVRRLLNCELDRMGPRALDTLNERLASVGSDWGYYPKDCLASRIHELLAGRVLKQGSVADRPGARRRALRTSRWSSFRITCPTPTQICSKFLIRRAGAAALADRLTVIAGPKVYSSPKRRFSSLVLRHREDAAEQRALHGRRRHAATRRGPRRPPVHRDRA